MTSESEESEEKRKKPKKRAADALTMAMSLQEFCHRHDLSLSHFYVLEKKGLTPTTMRVGGRRLVSIEEAKRWRAEREQQAVA